MLGVLARVLGYVFNTYVLYNSMTQLVIWPLSLSKDTVIYIFSYSL